MENTTKLFESVLNMVPEKDMVMKLQHMENKLRTLINAILPYDTSGKNIHDPSLFKDAIDRVINMWGTE
uniref:Uncharacterized protein n=1 Tax=viral metagenome TaxID=1070528 RepID=A0A6C0BS28_9ZZZZ